MSGKPADIPQDIWDEAMAVAMACGCSLAIGAYETISTSLMAARERERARWQPAVTYFEHYCQDEADDVENCVCGQEQHIAAKNFRDAIRNPSPAADPPRGDNISPSPLGAAGNDDFKRVQVIGSIE
jgi:hypothetical protein